MSQSRFTLKQYGQIQLNSHLLTSTTSGNLSIDNINLNTGNSSSIITSGNFSGGTHPIVCFTTSGNLIAPSNLYFNADSGTAGGSIITQHNQSGISIDESGTSGNLNLYTNNCSLQVTDFNSSIVLGTPNSGLQLLINNNSCGNVILEAKSNINTDISNFIQLKCSKINYRNNSNNYTFSQSTNFATSIICTPSSYGTIITQTATTATQSNSIITIVNPILGGSNRSFVFTNINGYTGTGLPGVNTTNIVNNNTSGSFDLVISNYHTTQSLNGPLTVSFNIITT